MSLRRLRIALWILVALVALGVGIFMLLKPPAEPPYGEVRSTTFQETIGGHFSLVDGKGAPFDSDALKGRPHAIFFGFTHCPDVCPTTLARLVRLRRDIGDDAFDIVFITVDPARDGPEQVGQYGDAFGSPVIGLTGSPAQVEQVKKQFGVASEKVPLENGDYTVDHTATVFLMDEQGRFVSTISPDEGRDAALAKLERIAG